MVMFNFILKFIIYILFLSVNVDGAGKETKQEWQLLLCLLYGKARKFPFKS